MIKIILGIEGMACGMCESHINDAIRRAFKVKKVSSSHSKGKTEIISEEPIDDSLLSKAISETGYRVISLTVEPYEKKEYLAKNISTQSRKQVFDLIKLRYEWLFHRIFNT